MSDTLVIEKPDTTEELSNESGKVAHIVLEGIKYEEGFTSASDLGLPGGSVVESRVLGTPVKALCGYEWVVTEVQPNRPICGTCLEVAKELGLKVPS